MASTKIEMDTGSMAVESAPTVQQKSRKLDLASKETWALLHELEKKKRKAADKRGAWKDAGRKARAEAKAIANEIAEVKRQLIAEHEAAKNAELEKQAAAAKRERSLQGDAA